MDRRVNPDYAKLLPGMTAGMTSTLVGYPADTMKVRLQTGMYSSLLNCVKRTYQVDGVKGFYRGALTPFITMAARRSYQYPIFDWLRSSNSNYLAGTIAGASGTIIGCPAHVLKIRMQNSHQKDFNNLFACGRDIWKSDGWTGFYRGFQVNCLKDLTFGCLFLGNFGTMKNYLNAKRNANEFLFGYLDLSKKWNMVGAGTAAGCISSLTAWTILFPVDTIKTAVQSKKGWDLVKAKRQAGILSFWKGLSPIILRAIPVSLASMFSYELVSLLVHDYSKSKFNEP